MQWTCHVPGKHFSVTICSLPEYDMSARVFVVRWDSIRLEIDCQVRKVNAPGSCGVAYLNGNVAPSSTTSSSSCPSIIFSFLSQDDLGTTLSIYTAILDRPVWFRQSSSNPMVTSNRLGFYITSTILRKPIENVSVSLSPQNTSNIRRDLSHLD